MMRSSDGSDCLAYLAIAPDEVAFLPRQITETHRFFWGVSAPRALPT